MIGKPDFSFLPVQDGYLRTPGTLHLHVDSRDLSRFTVLTEYVNKKSVVGKFSTLTNWVPGSQFHDDAHNAPGEGPEHFISIALKDRFHAVITLREILQLLTHSPGMVVEVERVLTYISSDDHRHSNGHQPSGEIFSPEVGFSKSPSFPVEIHHCFDLPKRGAVPFSLKDLCAELESEGLEVRTWSAFEKSDVWSFHSSLFTLGFAFDERCKHEFQILCSYLKKRNLEFRAAWVIAEEVLGIWQTPLKGAEDESYPNRVSVDNLIGATDNPIYLSELISRCHLNPTRGISAIAESEVGEIVNTLSLFEGVVRSADLEPILIELALCDDLPDTWSNFRPPNRSFAAHIVSYADTAKFDVLRAWLQAIDRIVEPGGLQIDPIVSHSETYSCGYLFDELHGRVEGAYRELTRGSAQEVRILHRAILEQKSESLISACRKIYAFHQEATMVPVDNTVVALSKGFVQGVLEAMVSIHSGSDQTILLQVFDKLLNAYLLIVPFHWPGKALQSRPGEYDKPFDVRPGGCLFVVLAPKLKARNVDHEQLRALAIRLGWLLFRAALEASHPVTGVNVAKQKYNPKRKKEVFEQMLLLREGLNEIKLLPSESRLQHLLDLAPFLKEQKSEIINVIGEKLKRPINVDSVLDSIVILIFERTSGTIYKWGKQGRGLKMH